MIPLAKNIKRRFSCFSLKDIAIVCIAVAIAVSVGVGVFLYSNKTVIINDNGKQVVFKTMHMTVGDALEQKAITVGPHDYINLPLDFKLQKMKQNNILIKRAVPINVHVDGKQVKLMTCKDTVNEALLDGSIKLSPSDKLQGAKQDDKIVRDMTVKVIRIKEELVSEKKSIPFNLVKNANHKLDQGTEKVIKEGKPGIREKLYKVVFEDGKEIARELLKDSVVAFPVSKIVEYGTVLNHKTSRGDIVRYKKVLEMRSTAYTASYADTGKHPGHPEFGITYTGMKVRKGVVAVDPRVIPLGTKMYIEVAGSTPDYGYAIAADIGSAVKGDIIDLYFEDGNISERWGRKKVKVYILD